MSLYNMIHGVKPSTFLILPVLGKHPEKYPRFRDCFIGDQEKPETEGKIIIYTRTGGGNRPDYEEENEAMRQMPGFIMDYDDSFDNTFAHWVFEIPEMWAKDVKKILDGRIDDVSPEYAHMICETFPKIAYQIRPIFNGNVACPACCDKELGRENIIPGKFLTDEGKREDCINCDGTGEVKP
jgi:hypothetical protein